MRLIAIVPVRNEDWVIGLSLRALLMWCDEAVVLDHASADGTADILAAVASEHPGRVTVLHEARTIWAEMAHRQRLLDAARERGASHVVIVDADEVLTGNLLPDIRAAIESLALGCSLRTAMYNMAGSHDRYGTGGSIWARAQTTVAFADRADLCWRANNGYDHHHREPYGSECGSILQRARGGVMHLQFSNRRRLRAKHALYKMIEVSRWPDKPKIHIDQLYNMAPQWAESTETTEAPPEWWEPYKHLLRHLNVSAMPWQEAECLRLYSEHGPGAFDGLELFGFVPDISFSVSP